MNEDSKDSDPIPLAAFPTLDAQILQSWSALDPEGTNDFLKELIQLFLTHSPRVIQQMRLEAEGGHSDGVRQLAHKLRGSGANLGALALAHLCADLEANALRASQENNLSCICEIEKEYALVEGQLNAFYQARQNTKRPFTPARI